MVVMLHYYTKSLFVLAWLLVGCSASAVPQSYSIDAAANATQQARNYEDAAATLGAQNARASATSMAATAAVIAVTRQAEIEASATAVAVTTTAEAQSVRATDVALQAAATGTAIAQSGMATATAIALNAIATGEAQRAQLAAQAAADAARELQIRRDREQFWNDAMPVILVSLLIAVCLAGAALFALVWRRWAPVREVADDSGRRVLVLDRSGGYSVLPPPPPRQLQAPVEVEGDPRPLLPNGDQQETPRVDLPESLTPSFVEIGVVPGANIRLPAEQATDFMIGGIKNSGKSNFLRMIAYQAYIHGWQLHLIDPEQLTFDPAVWGNVASTPEEAMGVMGNVLAEFERRGELFREAAQLVRDEMPPHQQFFVENLTAYNRAAERFHLPRLQRMMVIYEEALTHIDRRSPVTGEMQKLLTRNRKPGCHVAIAAHVWHSDHITSTIFNNLMVRVCFQSTDRTSAVILEGNKMANEIQHAQRGRAALMLRGGRPGFVQTYYIAAQRIFRDVHPEQMSVLAQPPRRFELPEVAGDYLQASIDGRSLGGVIVSLTSFREVGRYLYDLEEGASVSGQMINERVKPALQWRVDELGCSHAARLLARVNA